MWRVWIAYGPLFLLWGVVTGYQQILGLTPSFTDLLHINDLFYVIPLWQSGLLSLIILTLLLMPFIRFNTAFFSQRASLFKTLLVVLTFITLLHTEPWIFSSSVVDKTAQVDIGIRPPGKGSLRTLFAQERQRERARRLLGLGHHQPLSDLSFYVSRKELESHLSRRNVYIISMESWTNPDWMPGLSKLYPSVSSFAYPPFYKKYSRKLSKMRVRIFGGHSDQTHFEVLCGISSLALDGWLDQPTLAKYGHTFYCLPYLLNRYTAIANLAHNVFKESRVYSLMKIKAISFLRSSKADRGKVAGRPFHFPRRLRISDGRIPEDKQFEVLNNFTRPLLGRTPFFLFAETVTGHSRLSDDLEPRRKPDVFPKRGNLSPENVRLLNSYYYRTKDLYTYLETIQRQDPSAIILAFSDHLFSQFPYEKYGYLKKSFPSLPFNGEQARARRWIVPALFITHGQIKTFKGIFAEDFHKLLLNEVTNGWFCKRVKCSVGDISEKARKRRLLDYSIFYNATRRGVLDRKPSP